MNLHSSGKRQHQFELSQIDHQILLKNIVNTIIVTVVLRAMLDFFSDSKHRNEVCVLEQMSRKYLLIVGKKVKTKT